MQNLSIALLTIFIPLVFFLLDKIEVEWDRIVIIDKVIQAKKLFLGICLIFAPLFLWSFPPLRLLLFAIFVVGIWIIIKILLTSYRWLRTLDTANKFDQTNYRNILRNQYLAEPIDWSEKEKIWNETWRNPIDSNLEERNLEEKFLGNIQSLIDTKNFGITSRYLRTYNEYIEKRSMYDWAIYGNLYEKLLSWHFIIYKKDEQSQALTDEDQLQSIFQVRAILSILIKKMVVLGLEKGTAFVLFDSLKKHVIDKDKKYLETLFIQSVCDEIFDNVTKSRESHEIWSTYFKPIWKTTITTFCDKNNFISRIFLDAFFRWAIPRIYKITDDFDVDLNEVASQLFPSVDPILWANILLFLFSNYTDNKRAESIVIIRKNFGFSSRAMSTTSFGSPEQAGNELHQAIENERQSTIALVLALFGREFTIEKIEGYLAEFRLLNFSQQSREDAIKNQYINLFEDMLAKARKNTKPAPPVRETLRVSHSECM